MPADLRRRLLAILAADAAGYSRLVADDDRATVAALNDARTVFRNQVSLYGGRVIDTAGDSVLAVFESVTAAVEAALGIQMKLSVDGRGSTQETQLRFRIGLHLGDVLEQADGTVYGDGVNVASRLQALAEPGGIAVSQAIRNATRRTIDATFVDVGPQSVKNIAEPVRTYRMIPAGAFDSMPVGARARGSVSGSRTRIAFGAGAACLLLACGLAWRELEPRSGAGQAPSRSRASEAGSAAAATIDAGPLSLVVLPFANLTGVVEQEYVADGLTASVTGDLARIRDAYIVSAATARAYKAKVLTSHQVGSELGVRYVLQGNVQRSGTRIRISAQLSDSARDELLWSETFDGDSNDLFALQDQVTTRISTTMGRELVVRAARFSETRQGTGTAAEMMLQARGLELRPQSLENWRQIEALYRQVLKAEPTNVGALGGLAVSLVLQVTNFAQELSSTAEAAKIAEAGPLALKAKALDPGNPLAYRALASLAASRDDWDEAVKWSSARMELEPKSQSAFNSLAYAHYWHGEPEAALKALNQGLALDPKHPYGASLANFAKVELMLGHYDEAIQWSLKTQTAAPNFLYRDPTLAVAYELTGQHDKAVSLVAQLVKADSGFTVSLVAEGVNAQPLAGYYRKTVVPAMRKAGFPP